MRTAPDQPEQAFVTALWSRGIEPSDYQLVVHVDEVVGPMCFVRGPDGGSWTLAEFDASIRR